MRRSIGNHRGWWMLFIAGGSVVSMTRHLDPMNWSEGMVLDASSSSSSVLINLLQARIHQLEKQLALNQANYSLESSTHNSTAFARKGDANDPRTFSEQVASTSIAKEAETITINNNYERQWPQLDDTIRKAILGGTRIDPNITETTWDAKLQRSYYPCRHYANDNQTKWQTCEAPPTQLCTIVTAYYDMKSKHSWAMYEDWIGMMLTATDPMVIFVEPDNSLHNQQQRPWFSIVEARRQHAPTIVVPLPFSNFTMVRRFAPDFWWSEVVPTASNPDFPKKIGTDVYKLWNEKMILMEEVARLNPFQTEHVFWIDIGYYRRPRFAPNYAPILRNNVTANGLLPHQILFQNIFPDPDRYEIAGGAWGGTHSAIHVCYRKYFETLWWMVVNRYDCIGYEQRVFVNMCKSFPDLCNIHQSPYDKDWFAMGRSWLRSKDRLWNKSVTFLHNNETRVVELLPFPTEQVIQRVNRSMI